MRDRADGAPSPLLSTTLPIPMNLDSLADPAQWPPLPLFAEVMHPVESDRMISRSRSVMFLLCGGHDGRMYAGACGDVPQPPPRRGRRTAHHNSTLNYPETS